MMDVFDKLAIIENCEISPGALFCAMIFHFQMRFASHWHTPDCDGLNQETMLLTEEDFAELTTAQIENREPDLDYNLIKLRGVMHCNCRGAKIFQYVMNSDGDKVPNREAYRQLFSSLDVWQEDPETAGIGEMMHGILMMDRKVKAVDIVFFADDELLEGIVSDS